MKRSGPPKRRTPLDRRSQLAPGPGPRRKTRVKASDPKRRAKVWPTQYGPPGFVEFVHTLPCAVRGRGPRPCSGKIEAAHVRTKGVKGGWRDNVIPLCLFHHRHQGDLGIQTFPRVYGVDLYAIARDTTARWDRSHGAAVS